MVIDDLYIEGVATLEPEAHAPLVVDADAVLALAVALERFEPIVGWNAQIVQAGGAVCCAPRRSFADCV